jgi:hypothetical protein
MKAGISSASQYTRGRNRMNVWVKVIVASTAGDTHAFRAIRTGMSVLNVYTNVLPEVIDEAKRYCEEVSGSWHITSVTVSDRPIQ